MRPLLRCSTVLACALGAASAPAMPPEMERLALEGQAFLYELDFDRAEAAFGRLRREHPAHPAGACLLGAAAWWKARYAFDAFCRLPHVVDTLREVDRQRKLAAGPR
mgnify:CR=1 FL=1